MTPIDVHGIIGATDSYKWTHHRMYPKDTQGVYSYYENRVGARWPYTLFFGLQYLLKRYMVGQVATYEELEFDAMLAKAHFNNGTYFNYEGWAHIIGDHAGRLPLRIKAVPEGTAVPIGNVMMTVENTCPRCFWLTNAVETLLTHVWYSSVVATHSHEVLFKTIAPFLRETAHDMSALPYMFHDFGSRGAPTPEAAALGGAGHLLNSMGTDTVEAMKLLLAYYSADVETVGKSIPATEHSVMTARGRRGEKDVFRQLLTEFPTGPISVVGDSYSIYEFLRMMGDEFHDDIMQRDGKVIARPDSKTQGHDTPAKLMLWIADRLWHDFGGRPNEKSYKVLDPHVGAIWGDGLQDAGGSGDIWDILLALRDHSYSAESFAFGMGGGLLQKGIDRDTQRSAFKASAIARDTHGIWTPISKDPLDHSKRSKAGRLTLTYGHDGQLVTIPAEQNPDAIDVLELVFENGRLIKDQTLDEIRFRVQQPEVPMAMVA